MVVIRVVVAVMLVVAYDQPHAEQVFSCTIRQPARVTFIATVIKM